MRVERKPTGAQSRVAVGLGRIRLAAAALAFLAAGPLALGQGSNQLFELGPDTAADRPLGLAVTPDGRSALIVHRDTDNLTLYDFERGRVIATIPVGDGPEDLAIVPSGRYALVPNRLDGDVSVVSLAGLVETRRIDVSIAQPHRVLVSSDGRFAVITSPPGGSFSFATIDLSLGLEVAAWQTGLTSHSVQYDGLALDSTGARLVVSTLAEQRVDVYEVATGALLATSSVPLSVPTGISIRPDGTSVAVRWFGYSGLRGISMLSLQSYAWGANFQSAPSGLGDMAWLPDGATLVASGGAQGLHFIDVDTGQTSVVSERIDDFELTWDGAYAVGYDQGCEVLLIDTSLRSVIDREQDTCVNGALPKGLVAAPPRRGRRSREVAFLAQTETVGTIRVESGGLRVLPEVPTGEGPERDQPIQLEVLADGKRALTLNRASRNVSMIDLEHPSVLWDLDVGPLPVGMAVTADGRALVVDEQAQTLTVIELGSGAQKGRVSQRLVLPGQPVSVTLAPRVAGAPQRAYVHVRDAALVAVAVELYSDGAVLADPFAWPQGGNLFPGELVVTEDGARLFVVVSNRLLEFDAGTGQLLSETSTILDHVIQAGPDRLVLFLSSTIEVYDVGSTPPTLVVAGSPCPNVRALTADDTGQVLFAGCMTNGLFGGELMALDTESLTLLDTLPLPEGPVSLSRAGERIVAGSLSQWVAAFTGGVLNLVGGPRPLFGWDHELDISEALKATLWTYEYADLIEIAR